MECWRKRERIEGGKKRGESGDHHRLLALGIHMFKVTTAYDSLHISASITVTNTCIMLKENVTENRSRMHHRSFSAQTCESVFQPLELSSNPASSNVTLVNNPPIYQHHYQDSRINNPYQTLNGTIRIVERRNRLKQEGHQPRCSSVPVCTSRVQKSEDSGMGDYLTTGMNDSPTSVLRGVAPWMATEEKAVGIKKDSRNRIKHYAHSIRDHLLPLWGQVDFNGKPPPHPLSTHIHPLPEQW
ncbi:hypothetical protein EGR_03728 [Echinococcus granulosus]|uniref:Uncharacterized protein n=1 Tax=Echinococcus granulosus TaxID=6210 RepID=W6UK63_ECHGR|nr:hypothetical protein EGR_03728 [Echinococcus granulosus]EUB61438.1 hypothetical protein EGR_03728 [Echinococcus granulosus]